MKLLLDANLSPEVARLLKEVGPDAIHVADIGLLTPADPEILQSAAKRTHSAYGGFRLRGEEAVGPEINVVVNGDLALALIRRSGLPLEEGEWISPDGRRTAVISEAVLWRSCESRLERPSERRQAYR